LRATSCPACAPGWPPSETTALTTGDEGLTDHARRNRVAWDRQAESWREPGRDNSSRQLETARDLQREHGLDFPLLHGGAEALPLPGSSFDLALSEYGASIWCDPYLWVPEAARLLRPGGRLIFLGHATLLALCGPDNDEPVGDRLVRDSFGLHRLEWATDGSVEFSLPHDKWIDLFRASGFAIERLVALQAPEGASSRHTYVTPEWARRWPSEEIWRVRKEEASRGARARLP
jgi:SAM-dependent methyltransferase